MKKSQPRTRRTTLTLPAADLSVAADIARSRNVNLSVVVGEALHSGLKSRVDSARAERVIEAYRRSVAGLTEDDIDVLNGIIMEPAGRR